MPLQPARHAVDRCAPGEPQPEHLSRAPSLRFPVHWPEGAGGESLEDAQLGTLSYNGASFSAAGQSFRSMESLLLSSVLALVKRTPATRPGGGGRVSEQIARWCPRKSHVLRPPPARCPCAPGPALRAAAACGARGLRRWARAIHSRVRGAAWPHRREPLAAIWVILGSAGLVRVVYPDKKAIF